MLTFGSLFSGIGGFDLGFERAGMRCLWQCEINEQCRSVLRKHWPEVPINTDVTTLNATNAVRPDLICGGFPCQDLSVAGRRAGLAGERSGLFFELMRIVDELAPAWVCIENVPGLLSSNGGRDMGAVVGTLADLGYGWAYRVLDAQYFGLAQRRRRVFIVGCLGDVRRASEVLFERESLPWDSPPSRETGTRVAHCFARGTGSSGYRNDANGEDFVSHPLKAGGNLRQALSAIQKMGEPTCGEAKPAPPRVGVRRLMPIEAERLQGFPDGWTAGQSDSARYRMLGNAVAVPVAEWIGRRLATREERA